MAQVMNKHLARRGYSLLEWTLALGIVAVVVAFVLPSLGSNGRSGA